jgi:hypothetical protein
MRDQQFFRKANQNWNCTKLLLTFKTFFFGYYLFKYHITPHILQKLRGCFLWQNGRGRLILSFRLFYTVEFVRGTNFVIRMLLLASFWCMGVERGVMKFFCSSSVAWWLCPIKLAPQPQLYRNETLMWPPLLDIMSIGIHFLVIVGGHLTIHDNSCVKGRCFEKWMFTSKM